MLVQLGNRFEKPCSVDRPSATPTVNSVSQGSWSRASWVFWGIWLFSFIIRTSLIALKRPLFYLSVLPWSRWEEGELGGLERSWFKVRGCPGQGLARVLCSYAVTVPSSCPQGGPSARCSFIAFKIYFIFHYEIPLSSLSLRRSASYILI